MKNVIRFAAGLLALSSAFANNDIFPAQPAAEEAITWRNGNFLVDGNPTFLASGEIHYARVPKGLWRDRLWRMKMMGLNTVQTYVFWNAQEGTEGNFQLDGNTDLDGWLKLAKDMGLYAIVRPGPYNCAEWEHGGIPAWLTIKPGMEIRTASPRYLRAVDAYWEKILPIIAKNQIHEGGNVLMVQLENEYPERWGTEGNEYLQHLYDFARRQGLEVPLFYSGLHHGNDPAGEQVFPRSEMPWYSTEFWTGWIAKYGEMDPEIYARAIRGTWKIIAFGGAGYDYYVVHGGSNFGYTRGDEEGAAYDYSAPIGQAGQLRKAYFPMRRASSFATTFADMLGQTQSVEESRAGLPEGARMITRKSPAGTATFLDNDKGKAPIEVNAKALNLPTPGVLKLDPGEIRAVAVQEIPWTTNATIESLTAGVLGRVGVEDTTYLVCYGKPGETGSIKLRYVKGEPVEKIFEYPEGDEVKEVILDSGDEKTMVLLAMNTSLADRTWLLPEAVYVGPSFVQEDGTMEFPPAGGTAKVYSGDGEEEKKVAAFTVPELPKFSSWTWRSAAPDTSEAAKWTTSDEPRAMEDYDSFPNGYGWYRVQFESPADATLTLKFGGMAGDFRAFLNGKPADLAALPAKKGTNHLLILSMATPRPKMFNFIGKTGTMGARGIWGPMTVTGGEAKFGPWRFRGGPAGMDETPLIGRVTNWAKFSKTGWKPGEAPKGLPVFWRGEFDYAAPKGGRETLGLLTSGLKRGQVWINGQNLGPAPDAHPLYIPEVWLRPKNTIVIFDADGATPSEVKFERYEAFATGK